MSWLGTPLQEPQVTWVWHTAPAKSVEDLKANTILMGATAASADNSILPLLVNALIGTRMKVVTGYVGQNEINIAAERGEVQGNNTGLSNLTVNRADWMRDGKVRVLLQYGTERLAALKDVPTVIELAPTEADKALMRFYALKFNMARPIFAPPDVPADRIAALQAAFEATMKDERYLADAKKIGLDTNWLGARELTAQVRQIDETPQAVVDRLRDLLGAPSQEGGRADGRGRDACASTSSARSRARGGPGAAHLDPRFRGDERSSWQRFRSLRAIFRRRRI